MGGNTVASLPGTLHVRCLSMLHGYWRCPEPTQCHHDVRATTAYGCLPIRVHMVATTADATGRPATQGKSPYIFRYGKWGKSLSGVGRWGLLCDSDGAFFAP